MRWQRGAAQACPDDTAVERGKDALRPKDAVRQTTAVSRQGLPPHLLAWRHISTHTEIVVRREKFGRPAGQTVTAPGFSKTDLEISPRRAAELSSSSITILAHDRVSSSR